MKFIKFTLVLFSFALLIIACAETKTNNSNVAVNTTVVADTIIQPTASPDEFAVSRKIFSESCIGCHRANGEGGEKDFEGTKIKVPSYKSKGAMTASDDKLYDYIANGEEGEMPAFKDKLSDAQMRDLVKYIRREFQGK